MFKNYLITAWRNIARHKLYAIINIGGLAVGLAACILIFMFVRDEFSFDKFFTDSERLYKIETTIHLSGRDPFTTANTQAVFAEAFKSDFPDVEAITRFDFSQEPVLLENERYFQDVAAVDENFFSLFDFTFLEGSPETALSNISSVVITENMALKFFGGEPALGKVLLVKNDKELQVTGVLENLPTNTHFRFDMIRRINPGDYGDGFYSWGSMSFQTYLRLSPGGDMNRIQESLGDFSDRHVPGKLVESTETSASDLFQFEILALPAIHFYAKGDAGMTPPGNLAMVYGFAIIALLILGIAVINFINLATARFAGRTREVAVRKVVGASKKQLITQFLFESTGVVVIALLLALALVETVTPWFTNFFQQVNLLGATDDPVFLLGVAALVTIVGLGSGIYPSMYLSSIRPARVLGSNNSSDGGSFRLRTILVIFQFAISISLIVATAVVYSQLNYMRNLDLGFDKENVLVIRNMDNPLVSASIEPFINTLRARPDVVAVSRTAGVPGDDEITIENLNLPDVPDSEPVYIRYSSVDFDYLNTFGITPLAGRGFDKAIQGEVRAPTAESEPREFAGAIINLSSVRFLRFDSPEDAIGKTFSTGADPATTWTVIGVVPDMHFDSLRTPIEPTFYMVDFRNYYTLSVRYRTENLPAFLAETEGLWNDMIPGVPLVTDFLDDNLAALYIEEAARNSVLISFSILAIMVSALGLFGLASFTAERRTREVGIRKVMGASSMDIIRLMVWQFSKPVLIANLIAWPVAWYILNDWLSGFAYRIDLSPWYFAGAGVLALLIAWFTVAGHAYSVARNHPSEALRYE